jgi:hypothetical protein
VKRIVVPAHALMLGLWVFETIHLVVQLWSRTV